MVKCKVKTYQRKCNKNNKSSLKPKEKVLKVNIPKFNNKHKDLRWFQKDTTLTEKEKVAKRLAKAALINSSTGNKSIFGKKPVMNDLFTAKLKNRGNFDVGLSDSSEDEDMEQNVYKPTRLEEKIRESKIKKMEKREVDDNVIESSKSVDRAHLDVFDPDKTYPSRMAIKKSYDDSMAAFQHLTYTKRLIANSSKNAIQVENKPKSEDNSTNKLIRFLRKKGVKPIASIEEDEEEDVGIHKYLNYAEDYGADMEDCESEEEDLDESEEEEDIDESKEDDESENEIEDNDELDNENNFEIRNLSTVEDGLKETKTDTYHSNAKNKTTKSNK